MNLTPDQQNLKLSLDAMMKELARQLDTFRPRSPVLYSLVFLACGCAVALLALVSDVQGTASNILAGASTSLVTVGLVQIPLYLRERLLRRMETLERSIWLAAGRSWRLSENHPQLNFEEEYFATRGLGVFGSADLKKIQPLL